MPTTSIVRAGLALACVCLAACSSESKAPPAGTPTPAPAPAAGTPPAAAQPGEFKIQGNDLMQYDVKQIEVKPGQKVKITLKNAGSLPKVAMGHNLVVLRKGVTIEQFGPKVAAPKGTIENNYLPADALTDVIAHTKVLGPGESESVEFTAPGLPGELIYLCTFPGHLAVMNGKILVQ